MRLLQGMSTKDALQILYSYSPNQVAAGFAVALYVLVSIGVTAVTVKTKSWYMLLVTLTALLELAGWGSRLTTLSTPTVSTWGWQQSLIIISPVLLVIVQYLTLHKLLLLPAASSGSEAAPGKPTVARSSSAGGASSRIGVGTPRAAGGSTGGHSIGEGSVCSAVSHASAKSSITGTALAAEIGHPIIAMIVLWGFSIVEVICVVLQTSGAAVYASRTRDATLYGRLLLLAGLGIQLVFCTGLLILAAVMQHVQYFNFKGDKAFRLVFVCLYATTGLMNLRTIFRMAEFAQGYGRDIATHEAYLYVLDFVPMLLCFLLFACMHYGWWLGPDATAQLYRHAQHAKHMESAVVFVRQQQLLHAAQLQGAADALHVHCS